MKSAVDTSALEISTARRKARTGDVTAEPDPGEVEAMETALARGTFEEHRRRAFDAIDGGPRRDTASAFDRAVAEDDWKRAELLFKMIN